MPHGSSRLLINEMPLQVSPSLATAIGLDEALFLQQVHYWLKNSKHEDQGRYWIFNTYEEWLEQLPFFSKRKLIRIVDDLRKQELLLVRQASGFDRKNWYSINYEAFRKLFESREIQPRKQRAPSRQNGTIHGAKMASSDGAKMAPSHSAKMAPSYTESPESPENLAAPRLSAGEFNKRLMAYHKEHITGSIPNPAAQGEAIKALFNDGFSAEDAEAVYEAMRGDKWRTGDVSWLTVRKEIGQRLPKLKQGQSAVDGEDAFGATRKPRTFNSPEEFALATGKPVDEVRANWN